MSGFSPYGGRAGMQPPQGCTGPRGSAERDGEPVGAGWGVQVPGDPSIPVVPVPPVPAPSVAFVRAFLLAG